MSERKKFFIEYDGQDISQDLTKDIEIFLPEENETKDERGDSLGEGGEG